MKPILKVIFVCSLALLAFVATSSASNTSFPLTSYNQITTQSNSSFSLISISQTSSYKALDIKLDNIRKKLIDYRPRQAARLKSSLLININNLKEQITVNYKFNYQTNLNLISRHGIQLQTALNKDYRLASNKLYNHYKRKIARLNNKIILKSKKVSGSHLNKRIQKYQINKYEVLFKRKADQKINSLYKQYNQYYNSSYQKMILKINNNRLRSSRQATTLAMNNYRLLDNKVLQANLLLQRINSSFTKIIVNKTLPTLIPGNNDFLNKILIKSLVPQPSKKPPRFGVDPLIVYQKSKLICLIGKRYSREKQYIDQSVQQIKQYTQKINNLKAKRSQTEQTTIVLNNKINTLVSKLNTASITEYDKYTQQIAKYKKQISRLNTTSNSRQEQLAQISRKIQNSKKAIKDNKISAYKKQQRKLLAGVRGQIKKASYKRCSKLII